ncbi:hypothetical protein [Nocardia sp. NPDC057272]|uniref:hypothetical protein n=1 Tax=Nocardia sp. NPDC057272 TaxID=3346079 RepID=UPI0036284DC1
MSSNVRRSSPCRAAKLSISCEGLELNGHFAVLVLRRFADPTLPVPPRIADPR